MRRDWPTEDEARQLRTLVWLAQQDDRMHELRPCYLNDRGGWLTSNSAKLLQDDARALVQNGLVEGSKWGSVGSAEAKITPSGRARADEVKRRWIDKPARVAACRSNLLRWLYSEDAVTSRQALDPRDFFSDEHSFFFDRRFSDGEVEAARSWLLGRHLIDGPEIDGRTTRTKIWLTAEGLSCVEDYDGDIARFIEKLSKRQVVQDTVRRPSKERASGPVINIHGGQVQMATGEHSRQSMNVGLAAEQVALVIQGIAEMVQGLQLNVGQETEFERTRQQALDDITSGNPTGRGVRQFYDWVVGCVKQGSSAALVAGVTAAANGMLHDADQLARAVGH